MPDTETQPLPTREQISISQERQIRQRGKTNRSPIGKGILVNIGENIQFAIDAAAKDGGGVVNIVAGTHKVNYMINLPSGVSLNGDGRDVTILDFDSTAFGIQIGDGNTFVRNFKLSNFTIKNSNHATAALNIDPATGFQLDNIRITACTTTALRIRGSILFTSTNSLIDLITGKGLLIDVSASSVVRNFNFVGLDVLDTTGTGVHVSGDSNTDADDALGNFISCRVDSGNSYGFHVSGGGETSIVFNSCDSRNNANDNWLIETSLNTLIACNGIFSTGGRGFVTTVAKNRLIGCNAENNVGAGAGGAEDYDLANGTVFVANIYNITAGLTGRSFLDATDKKLFMAGNFGGDPVSERVIGYMDNKSGGTRAAGETVSYRQTSNTIGDQFVSPAAYGEDYVAGMLLEETTSDNSGAVLFEGYTEILKVNGTTDIAVGDFLSAYSSGGVAAKARNGDTAFAIALEAYATDDSSGVITALLIKPRKIGAYPTVATPTIASSQNATGETLGGSYDDITNFEATGTFTSGQEVLILVSCQYFHEVLSSSAGGHLKLRDATAGTDLRTFDICTAVSEDSHFASFYKYTIPSTASRRFVVQGLNDDTGNTITIKNVSIVVMTLTASVT